MLNTLHFTRNAKGFVLPYVLFVLVIVMVLVVSAIHIYQNNMQLTKHHIQQIQFETLFQMGLASFKEDVTKDDLPLSQSPDDKQKKLYAFPDGDVTIRYRKADPDETEDMEGPVYYLKFDIMMENQQHSFSYYAPVPKEEE